MRRDAAPFDHPALGVPNGQVGTTTSVSQGNGGAADTYLLLPAVGRNGTVGPARPNFLNIVEYRPSVHGRTEPGILPGYR